MNSRMGDWVQAWADGGRLCGSWRRVKGLPWKMGGWWDGWIVSACSIRWAGRSLNEWCIDGLVGGQEAKTE